jgi:hypothetical protein
MDFDVKTNTFSNLFDFATDPTQFLGWPSFTPDGDVVVYHSDNRSDHATWQVAKADLHVAHLPSKTTVALDVVNGYRNGQVYLPFGEEEAHLNYEPTILPVPVGGYYWIVFTSRRKYGNTIQGLSQDDLNRKKLWVAALDMDLDRPPGLDASKARDGSHPAFYLNGQELASGNMRGFWALDPCKANGGSCETGAECCGGFCRPNASGAGNVCVEPPTGCSQEFEKCTTSADCCVSRLSCINGRCGYIGPS